MRVQFIASEVAIGLRRNLAITISVILVTFVSLLFVGLSMLFREQIDVMKGYWYDRVQVSIFLCGPDSTVATCASGEVTQAERDQIVSVLSSPQLEPYVETYFYESQQEAYDRFVEQFEDSSFVENVTPDQLPESYRVRLVDPEQYAEVSNVFASQPGVEEVEDQRELLDRFFDVLSGASLAAGVLALVMLVAATLLVSTTIRLAAFSRRREVGIMRLVGASNLFIRTPFILEGVLAAVLGAATAVAALWALVRYGVQGQLATSLPFTQFVTTGDVWAVSPVLFLAGVGLAGVSSFLTLQVYLKV